MGRGARACLLLASFLSGAAALNYELLWVRELTLVAGSTQAAISAVLSAYFLGLALGNHLAGRAVRGIARPLLVYAGAEIVIGLWAILFHPLLGGAGALYGSLYARLAPGSAAVHLLRLGCSAVLLIVPATCMGATLPLLVQAGARDLPGAPRWSALVYGANTLGAMAGTFATGFFLIERLGVATPLALSASLNLACAALAWPWARARVAVPGGKGGGTAAAPAPADASGTRAMILVAFGVLGFANIALEVLWTRFFALIYPNDTYVFSTLLLIYLLGVGAGSLIGQRLLPRVKQPVVVLGLLQIVSAAAGLAMILYVPSIATALAPQGHDFGRQLAGYFAAIGAGTILPTLCMGASFPLLVGGLVRRPEQAGGIVGRALALNTLGGVLGSAVGGFVMLDRWGLAPGLFATAGLIALVGLVLCGTPIEGRRVMWVPTFGLGLPLLVGFLALHPRIPEDLFAMHFADPARTRILETRTSVHGTVAITEDADGTRRVWINSAWVASERAHLSFGYAPWLLHPGPVRAALGICCGTGRTFGALMQAGIPDLDLVDINAAVIALSGKWLARSNHGVLTDPRARVTIDDGRNFVRYGEKKYDLITLEPLQMFQKGVAYFYTEPFYREARARMAPGGILCQWVPLYLLDEHEFRSVVRTFLRVFPNSLLWGRRGYSLVLLGYNSGAPVPDFRAAEIYDRMARDDVRADLAQEEMLGRYDPLAYVLVDGRGLEDLAAGGEVYTDDRPTLEFTSPRSTYAPDANLAAVMRRLVPLDGLFHLDDPRLAGEIEELRRLTLEVSFTHADLQELIPRIRAARRALYPEEQAREPAGAGAGPE